MCLKFRLLLLFILLHLFYNCSNDDEASSTDSTNLPPILSGQIDISFTPEGVVFEWNAAIDPENDEITNYIVRITSREIGSSYDFSGGYSSSPTDTIYTRVLAPNLSYRVTIEAKDILGNISENPLVTQFDYVNSAPNAVSDVDINKGLSSVTLNWAPSTDPDNDSVEYHVEWFEFNYSFPETLILKDTFITTNTSITISNLEESIKYWVNIYAVEQTPFAYRSESDRTYFAILPLGNTYFGDIILRDQGDVDIFKDHTYTTIEGSVSVFNMYEGYGDHPLITNFSALSGLQTITGDLNFSKVNRYRVNLYDNFYGFHNLETVGGTLRISDTFEDNTSIANYPIKDLNDFSSLTSVGDLLLTENIQGLSGEFPLLEVIGNDLDISGNGYHAWASISPYEFGFPSLQTIGGSFSASGNRHITGINFLENIETIGENLLIRYDSGVGDMISLESVGNDFEINGLNNTSTQSTFPSLHSIGGNLVLRNVDTSGTFNLDNLENLDGSFIYDNSNITQQSSVNLSFASLNSFSNSIYIEGSLFNNLNFLMDISSISNLTLINNINLNQLSSFDSLDSLVIKNNDALTSIDVNSNSLGLLIIENNDVLSSLDFSNLSFSDNAFFEVTIHNNDSLNNLAFGNSITQNGVAKVQISDNDQLIAINGLNGFNQFSNLEIVNNPVLINISAFNNLSTIHNCLQIYNNDDLTNLDFLSNLNTINCGDVCMELYNNGSVNPTNNLVVKGNYNLGDFCGLTTLFSNEGLCFEQYSILENGYNPSHLDIINSNCSN